jgi:hypothetical protein
MEVSIGEELDKEGFEYANHFSTFSISNKRRSHNVLDCVRRRKWVRTRAPTASSIDEKCRPLIMFWDVHVLENGTKKVRIYIPIIIIFAIFPHAYVRLGLYV